MSEPWLSEDEQARAAFDLLTCSTSQRFAEKAFSLVNSTSLRDKLASNSEALDRLIERARHLWRCVAPASQRQAEEAELALLTVLLGYTADERAEDLLLTMALSGRPSASWLAALARQVLGRRANSELTPIVEVDETERSVSTVNRQAEDPPRTHSAPLTATSGNRNTNIKFTPTGTHGF